MRSVPLFVTGIKTVASRRGESLRIFLCGDVMTGRGVDQILPHPGDPELREPHIRSALGYVALAEKANGPIMRPAEPDDIWGAAMAAWRRMSPDVRLINLETAVTRSSDFASKGINYRMTPENAACLTAAGVDACALANNHVLDFGPSGLVDTLAALKGLGLRTAGAGRDLAEASAPAVVPIPGRSVRVIFAAAAFRDSGVPPGWRAGPHAPGVNLVEPSEAAARELATRIEGLRRAGDVGVVSIHWGSNWGYRVPETHRRLAHALIDSGQVSVVHGHSSHHPRPVEIYRGRLILYGCGDFLNDYEGIRGYEAFRSEIAAMYFTDLAPDGALSRLELSPLVIRKLRLNEATAADAAWLMETLTRVSQPFGVAFRLEGSGRLVAVA